MTDFTAQQNQTASYVDDYVPPSTPQDSTDESEDESESLEDQNIFDLLGISEADDTEKEQFLDELQQVIWEDFVDKDVELLLTEDELNEFKAISGHRSISEDDRQAEMIDYLEKLIPDLEKIMLEKALDLKEDMTRQRITEYLEHFQDNPASLEVMKQAQTFADAQQWRSVAKTLNAIPV